MPGKSMHIVNLDLRSHLVSIIGRVASRYDKPMIFEEDFAELAVRIEESFLDLSVRKELYDPGNLPFKIQIDYKLKGE